MTREGPDRPDDAAPASLLSVLRRIEPTLAPGPRAVARRILDDPTGVAGLSLDALAERTGTSPSTVTRLAEKAGYGGYRGLRTAIALAAGAVERHTGPRLVTHDIDRADDVTTTVAKLAAEERRAIEDTAAGFDVGDLERAAELVVGARAIVVIGIAASGLVATDLATKLGRIGLVAQAVVEGHAALTAALVMRPEDLLVVVSSSGGTTDVVEPLLRARERGVATLALTTTPGSPVSAADTTLLSVSSRENPLRPAAMASRTGQMFVVDVLFTLVAQRTFETSHAAVESTWRALAPRRAGARPALAGPDPDPEPMEGS